MITRTILNNQPLLPALVVLLVGVHLTLDYTRGGIPAHHLLADPDLPAISNLWGLLLLPLVAWIVVARLRTRLYLLPKTEVPGEERRIGRRFLSGLAFGILIALLWETGNDAWLSYLILLPALLSLFVKVYGPAPYMGFVLGMAYTFGGVLPVIIGLVLLLFCWGAFALIRSGIRRLWLLAK